MRIRENAPLEPGGKAIDRVIVDSVMTEANHSRTADGGLRLTFDHDAIECGADKFLTEIILDREDIMRIKQLTEGV